MKTARFSAAERGQSTLVHDPATGLTHLSEEKLLPGRVMLDPRLVSGLPTVVPRDHHGDFPLSICWSPVVRCNLHCPHCLDDKTVAEAGPTERVRIAEVIGAADVLGVDISGGEPLLLGDLADLSHHLSRGGSVVSVTTNGWHLRRRAAALAEHIDAVRVSLDGPAASVHDVWRGEGSFTRAVDGIRAAVTAGMRVQIQTVLMASTRGYAQEVVYLAAELGANGVTFLQMLPIGEGTRLGPSEMLTDKEAQELVRELAVPQGITMRLRTRGDAGGFTVVRADGRIWRNGYPAEGILGLRPLRIADDLALTGPDGSA
ncbi:Probable coenzyme PQQ synthesis protein E PqqE [Mycobacterium tuberculosis]|nr:Probable coenzyme PQQ synthesis protein E PqqE [Mycobacterium tuberculosis]